MKQPTKSILITSLAMLLTYSIALSQDLQLIIYASASECANFGSGQATVIVSGGDQANGHGNLVEQLEDYGETLHSSGGKASVGDLNGDGFPDIFDHVSGGAVDILLNDGDGTFTHNTQTFDPAQGGTSALGDLDGDGDLDVFFGGSSGARNFVLQNDGTGYFTRIPERYYFEINQSTSDVELGDLDGDGDLDAVTVAGYEGYRIWGNNGDGTFYAIPGNSIVFPNGTTGAFWGVALGDLDNDGDLDMYLTHTQAPDEVWFNDGTGVFTKSLETYGSEHGRGVVLDDFDGDGDLDAFVAILYLPNHVYLNDGDGTFTLSPMTYGDNSPSNDIQLGDFNMDGKNDVIITRSEATRAKIYFSNGDGTFNHSSQNLNSTNGLNVGDFDLDGDLDAFLGWNIWLNDEREVNPYNYLWDSGTGNQTTETAVSLLPGTYSVTVTDAIGIEKTASVTVGGPEQFSLSTSSTNPTCIGINDGQASVSPNGGPPFTFKMTEVLATQNGLNRLKVGDLDNDGDLDIFQLSSNSSVPGYYERAFYNNGDGTFVESPENYNASNHYGLELGDVDNDGYLDVFIGTGASFVLKNDQDGTFTQSSESYILCTGYHCQYGARPHSYGVGIGDLDGDQDLDVFLANNQYQYNQVLINDGDGTFTFGDEEYGSSHDFDVELGDLDGDGDLDAFVISNLNQNSVWLNDGDATFTRSTQILGQSYQSRAVALGDLDGDGDLDAFVANDNYEPNLVWLNNGDGTFVIVAEDYGRERSHGVDLGDLDGDGDLDVYIANLSSPDKIWLNDGDGTYTEYPQDFWHGASQDVVLDDLDGDGDLDAATTGTGKTRIWINQPNCFTYQWDAAANNQTTQTAVALEAGFYHVTVTDASGCEQVASVTVHGADSNEEICDGIDNNCDGQIDEGFDLDLDGFTSCDGDCDDNDPNNFPGNTEVCDGQDNDCDGLIDDDDPDVMGQITWYVDSDGDGFGDPDSPLVSCDQPTGYVSVATDCDDNSPLVYPGAMELPDQLDNDCDGQIDEDLNYPKVDIGDCATVYLGYEPEECADLSASITNGTAPFTFTWSTGESTDAISVCPTETSTYGITVTDANNLTAEDEITVQVIDIQCGNGPNPKILICHYPPGNPDNPQTICISVDALETHLTEHGDHIGICGAVDPCAVDPEPFSTSNQNANSLSEAEYFTRGHEDGQEISAADLLIYPNPASNDLTIKYTQVIRYITIYAITGEIVGVYTPHSSEAAIHLADLGSGTYIVQIQSDNGSVHNKRVVVIK